MMQERNIFSSPIIYHIILKNATVFMYKFGKYFLFLFGYISLSIK